MLLDVQDSQLVLVDYQAKLMPVIHQGGDVLARATFLAKVARLLDVPVWGTEQNPEKLGLNDAAVRDLCQKTFSKTSFDASQSGLVQALRPAPKSSGNARSLPKHLQKAAPPAPGRSTVVLAGVEAHVCLLQTALGLLEQEFDVWVVTDACGSRRERDRDAAFDRLAGNGVELVTSEMVAFEWLEDCEHPNFRDVLQLIKG
ncbi:isochorismatase family protein [Hydrogenophaga aquatica]